MACDDKIYSIVPDGFYGKWDDTMGSYSTMGDENPDVDITSVYPEVLQEAILPIKKANSNRCKIEKAREKVKDFAEVLNIFYKAGGKLLITPEGKPVFEDYPTQSDD